MRFSAVQGHGKHCCARFTGLNCAFALPEARRHLIIIVSTTRLGRVSRDWYVQFAEKRYRRGIFKLNTLSRGIVSCAEGNSEMSCTIER